MRSLIAPLLALALVSWAQADTTITFQGQLKQSGAPHTGTPDMEFRLFDHLIDGEQVGSPVVRPAVPVEEGLFQVELDFGPVFDGSPRFLEITVAGATLSPRQPIRPAPVAVHVSEGVRIAGDFEGVNFRAGHPLNEIVQDVVGATVAGGGKHSDSEQPNRVTDHFGTIGGGTSNQAMARWATVGGGDGNTAGGSGDAGGSLATVGGGHRNTANHFRATVGGGGNNTASGREATVGGGAGNIASGFRATVGGGVLNTASGLSSIVPGGGFNTAEGESSFAAGLRAQALHAGTFVWADRSSNSDFASTASNRFLIRAARVGIGTNAPQRKLHVVGDRIRLSDTAGNKVVDLRADGAKVDLMALNTDLFILSGGPSGNNRVILNPAGGEVGIGTANPGSFKLAVNGSAAKPGGGSWSDFSDARLKRNLKPLEPGMLGRLLSLRAWRFEYTDEAVATRMGLPGPQWGLLAQEVAEVFPEWVGADEEGYLYVTERNLAAVLVEALRELHDANTESMARMQAENADMRRDLAKLQVERQAWAELAARVAALEAGIPELAATEKLAESPAGTGK